jgi:hypothetical protein
MSKLGQINRVKHAFNSTLLTTIIHMLVFSKLFYCSSVWSTTSAGNIARVQHVQNFAARIISGTRKFDHITCIENLKVASRQNATIPEGCNLCIQMYD